MTLEEEDPFSDIYDDNAASIRSNIEQSISNGPQLDRATSESVNDIPRLNGINEVEEEVQEDNDEEVNSFTEIAQSGQMVTRNDEDNYLTTEEIGRPLVEDREEGKMFIGGLNWETSDETLKDYFSQFGEVTECQVMRDPLTGRSRGFGFLTFRDSKCVNSVMVKEHVLDGKIIDPKRAIPKSEQEKSSKIFVGGVAPSVLEPEFRQAFEQFGNIIEVSLMIDKGTGRSRGFGFITFDTEEGVDNVMAVVPISIAGKFVEVKRAQPRGVKGDEDIKTEKSQTADSTNDYEGSQIDYNDPSSYPNGQTPSMMAYGWYRMQLYLEVSNMLQTLLASSGSFGFSQQLNSSPSGLGAEIRNLDLPQNISRNYQGNSYQRLPQGSRPGTEKNWQNSNSYRSGHTSLSPVNSSSSSRGSAQLQTIELSNSLQMNSAVSDPIKLTAGQSVIPSGPRAFRTRGSVPNAPSASRQSTHSFRSHEIDRSKQLYGSRGYHPYSR
ncbi:uncharacterized protein V1516DRAFT_674757 [Lipomyces oligophaga]|uniref:uncharacterized protein n=1 Tax=Lipomyces oligophaga TaxID=45792 RepID=UPI0034CE5772